MNVPILSRGSGSAQRRRTPRRRICEQQPDQPDYQHRAEGGGLADRRVEHHPAKQLAQQHQRTGDQAGLDALAHPRHRVGLVLALRRAPGASGRRACPEVGYRPGLTIGSGRRSAAGQARSYAWVHTLCLLSDILGQQAGRPEDEDDDEDPETKISCRAARSRRAQADRTRG